MKYLNDNDDPFPTNELMFPDMTIDPKHPPPSIDPKDAWENNIAPITHRADRNLKIIIFVLLGVSTLTFLVTFFLLVRRTLRDSFKKSDKEKEKQAALTANPTPPVTPRVQYCDRMPSPPIPPMDPIQREKRRVRFNIGPVPRRVPGAPKRYEYPYYINQQPPPSRTAWENYLRGARRKSSINGAHLSRSIGSPKLPSTIQRSSRLDSDDDDDDDSYLACIEESPDLESLECESPLPSPKPAIHPSRFSEHSRGRSRYR